MNHNSVKAVFHHSSAVWHEATALTCGCTGWEADYGLGTPKKLNPVSVTELGWELGARHANGSPFRSVEW